MRLRFGIYEQKGAAAEKRLYSDKKSEPKKCEPTQAAARAEELGGNVNWKLIRKSIRSCFRCKLLNYF